MTDGDFTKIDGANEHTFARFLRRNRAIDNWQSYGHTGNMWFGPDGKCVGMVTYDEITSDCSYYIRSDLTWEV